MAKFCGNCGAMAEDNANVCGNCGAPFATSKSGAGDIFSKIPGVNDMKPEQKALITKIAKIAIPVAAAVILILVLVFAVILPNTGAKGALQKYFKSGLKADAAAYIELMPEKKQLDYRKDEDTSMEEAVEDDLKTEIDRYEEEYGKNIKVDIKITEVDDIKNSTLKEIKDKYERNEKLNKSDVEEGVEIDFDIAIKGKDEDDDGDGKAILIKEKGEWKVWSVEYDV